MSEPPAAVATLLVSSEPAGRRRITAVAIGGNGEVLRGVRAAFAVGATRELSDGQLLERFATGRGESAELAFAALVERHGPMVLRVCRGVLAEPHDAQDAFQATFLVLVRRARSLWVRDSLGPWLHQVAYRTASCLLSSIARRRRLERGAAGSGEECRVGVGDELIRVLHEELGRLPERYRAPVVLCDLEASTHEQAARHLGWPIGTVKSRLTRAREILRDRLRRRGVGPDLGLLTALRLRGVEALLSPSLVDSTTRAVVRFAGARALDPGPATSLAGEVLRTMTITRWMKAATLLAVVGATVGGAGALGQKPDAAPRAGNPPQAARADGLATAEVKAGKFRVAIVERGNVEAERVHQVVNDVEGTRAIIWLVPEGTRVKAGDKVVELDSSTLHQGLKYQKGAIARAEADLQNARAERELAELALREHEASLGAEQEALRRSIAASRSAVEKAEARLERARRARQRLDAALAARKGDATPADIAAELAVDDRIDDAGQVIAREKAALGAAEARLDVLQKYTVERTKKALGVDIERKRTAELERNAAWELEKNKQAKLARQVEKCILVAPNDGIVVYGGGPRRNGVAPPRVEEGVMVGERQVLVSLVDLDGGMRINTKVHEPRVDRLARGQHAQIKVDAFSDLTMTGVVEQIAPLPDPPTSSGFSEKVYTTLVRIEDAPRGLRPGMTASVEIPIVEREDVLTVPVTAVLRFEGKDHVAVRTPDGFACREVLLGETDESAVEVKQGLRAGESVVLDPAGLMSEAERRTRPRAPTEPASPPRPVR
jgi:RNA polymerase sigma factor (sigma-70 family)